MTEFSIGRASSIRTRVILGIFAVGVMTAAAVTTKVFGDPSATRDRPHPKAPAETAQLAFLIGEWKLEAWFPQPDGSKREQIAAMTGRYVLDGFGVETVSRYPGDPDFLGTRTLVYNRQAGKWIGSGINTLGNRKDFEGVFADGELTMIQSGMLFGGRPGINRMVFFDIGPDGFKQRTDQSIDDGKTWREGTFGYTATRIR